MRASLRHRGSFVLPFLIALLLAFCGGSAAASAAAGPKAHAASATAHKASAKKHAKKRKAAKKHKKASKHAKKHRMAKKRKKSTKRKKAKKKARNAAAAAGTLSAGSPAASTNDEQARLASTVRVAPAFFGVVANEALGETGAQRDATLGQIRGAGAGLLRQKMDWATIERAPGVYDFTAWDQYMLATATAGLQVLPVLFNPPAFDSADPNADGTAPPRDNADFARFATAAVQRYGPSGTLWAEHPEVPASPIHSWQVWNEPNCPQYWADHPDGAAYASMLRTVSAALRAADGGAEVVAGGLPACGGGTPIADFVDEMYAAGAKGSFDTLAVHGYAKTDDGTIDIVKGARDALDAHRDSAAQIWITELGWATGGPTSVYTAGSAAQAQSVGRVMTRLASLKASLRLRGVIYYAWQDAPPYAGGKDFWGLHTGLRDLSGAPKPALQVFSDTARLLTS